METSVATQSASDRYCAGLIHTLFLLVILGAWAFMERLILDRVGEALNVQRVRSYVLTLFFEWFLFAYVMAGVRHRGSSTSIVLGNRWHSGRQLLKDAGIAVAFWIASGVVLLILGHLVRVGTAPRIIEAMLPRSYGELFVWIALSITAGICEEAVFRGYLQHQFVVLTRSAPAGIILSAAVFGVAHMYQGPQMVLLIGIYGAMFGILAHWRGSVRPGILAHAWQDSLNGIVAVLARG
jgi:membrane protease YdiL (CAAX protease family)